MIGFDPFVAAIFRENAWHAVIGAPVRDVIDPATVEPVGRIAICGHDTVAAIIDRANEVRKAWAALDTKTRAGLLHRVADSIEQADHRETSIMLTREMGKPYPEAIGEVANVASIFRYYAEMARDDAGHIAGTTQAGSFQYEIKAPYGVSVHIIPFNFPILIMAWTVAASLAAGNAVIVKPAEATSLSTLMFMKHFACLPPGLVSCVTGGGETAQHLIRSDGTHVVAFTGGVESGRKVNVACAELMKPCIIEAGGNDAMIVSDSALLDVAIAGSVTSAFHLSGQICTSSERFFVCDTVHDDFVAGFVKQTKALRIGNGLDKCEIGPLVSEAARDKVMRLVDGAVQAGAKIECGGRVPPEFNKGWFYEPTILTGVTPDMEIMNTEIFGPVAPICRVRDFEEGLTLANQSRFGLGACVFTESLDEAMEAANRLEAGMVWVNNPLVDNDALPFGGWKLSGVGRELGRVGLDAFRQSRMVVIDHKPKIHDWWYPYPDGWFLDGGGRKA